MTGYGERLSIIYGFVLNGSNLKTPLKELAQSELEKGHGIGDEVILIMANANPAQLEAAAKEARAVIYSRLKGEFDGKCGTCEFAAIDHHGIGYTYQEVMCDVIGGYTKGGKDFGCIHYKWDGEVVK